MELLSNKTRRRTAGCVATLTAAGLSFGVVTAMGGSAGAADGTTGTTGDTAAKTLGAPGMPPMGGPGGGPLGQLTDDQIQCLKDEGVSVPDKPKAGETPQPPDSSDRPDPDQMKSAAEACDVDLPAPPSGGMPGGPPPQGDGAPCGPPPKGADSNNNSGSSKNN